MPLFRRCFPSPFIATDPLYCHRFSFFIHWSLNVQFVPAKIISSSRDISLANCCLPSSGAARDWKTAGASAACSRTDGAGPLER
ncbi:hypothetical protein AXF42_Ash020498 [Apostasia shenzhenica]|uniref:Uncharacterized protein n=1 Tax=Apostasia shenzhenica TaxID=1088818 RepID=A0A2H9ZZ97_9ASPA|nr:hypothetical protein AXF42_Ash020498 [Apostasia shenzhenica]